MTVDITALKIDQVLLGYDADRKAFFVKFSITDDLSGVNNVGINIAKDRENAF